MLPLIVSFYTNDWEYPEHAKRLKKECEALGLEYRIEERPSAGGYLQNTCLKPFFIRDMLEQERRPVLWIDVDGSICAVPKFFRNLAVDFAAKRMSAQRKRTWHVGTMYFNYTPATLSFVNRWCELSGPMSDESALESLWRETPNITTSDIPPEYFELAIGRWQRNPATVIYHRISDSESKRLQRPTFWGDREQ